jgi:hypothetical protein
MQQTQLLYTLLHKWKMVPPFANVIANSPDFFQGSMSFI